MASPSNPAERTANARARLNAGLTVAALLTIALIVGLLALMTYVVVQNNRLVTAEERNVREHRHANQADHDDQRGDHECLLQLVLLLNDPARDRMQPVPNPCPAPDLPRPNVPR